MIYDIIWNKFFIGTYVIQLSLLCALHKMDIGCVTLKKWKKNEISANYLTVFYNNKNMDFKNTIKIGQNHKKYELKKIKGYFLEIGLLFVL